jgi:hypothetical protein
MKYLRIMAVPAVVALAIMLASGAQATYIAVSAMNNLNVISDNGAIVENIPVSTYDADCLGAAFAPNGDIYTGAYTTGGSKEIDKYAYLGSGSWATAPVVFASGLSAFPGNLTVDASGNVYVSTYNTYTLMKFNPDGSSAWSVAMPVGDTSTSGDIRIAPAGNSAGITAGDVCIYRQTGGTTVPGICCYTPSGSLDKQIGSGSYAMCYGDGGFDFNGAGNIIAPGNTYGPGAVLQWTPSLSLAWSDATHMPASELMDSMIYGPDYNGDGTGDYYFGDSSTWNKIFVYSGVDHSYLGTIGGLNSSVRTLSQWTPTAVPEPSSLLVLIPGVAGLLGLAARKRS